MQTLWWSIKVRAITQNRNVLNALNWDIIPFLDTTTGEVEDCFKRYLKRDDIAIILINQNIAEMIRHLIDAHTAPTPAILEIPSKDHPYDPTKDSILRRAKVKF